MGQPSRALFGHVVEALVAELQTGACLRDVARYWQFRSTVPGPGLRAASQFLAERHRHSGLDVEELATPTDHPPVRRGADVPDLTMWSILSGQGQERGMWGFSLTPRQGAG